VAGRPRKEVADGGRTAEGRAPTNAFESNN
jgi:hypothetical protein